MRKPLNIAAGLFTFAFAANLAIVPGTAQAQNTDSVSGCGQVDETGSQIVGPQKSCSAGSTSTATTSTAGNTSQARSAQNAVDASTAPPAEQTQAETAAAPAEDAPKPESQVITKTEEKGVLDYLPWPAELVAKSLASVLN